MRALTRSGPSKTLSITSELESTLSILHHISVRTTALTRGELAWPEPLLPSTPIPGYDLTGIVLSSPSNSRFQPGDEVYALTNFSRQGNAREISEASEDELAIKPKNLSFEEAATVPLSALSAWQGLFVHGGLIAPVIVNLEEVQGRNRGKRVLVTAAAGGVGLWAVQLAKLAGAEVVGTCGRRNVEFVKGLGVDVVLDYSETGLREWVSIDEEQRAFDVVLDCVGKKTEEEAWLCVKEKGVMVSVAEPPESKKPIEGVKEGVQGKWFIVESNGEQLKAITTLIEEGRCRAIVDSVYDLNDWKKAFERVEGGHARGKVVLKVK